MERLEAKSTPVGHYDELAPVCDFVISRRCDFDAIDEFVGSHLPETETAAAVVIVVGAEATTLLA